MVTSRHAVGLEGGSLSSAAMAKRRLTVGIHPLGRTLARVRFALDKLAEPPYYPPMFNLFARRSWTQIIVRAIRPSAERGLRRSRRAEAVSPYGEGFRTLNPTQRAQMRVAARLDARVKAGPAATKRNGGLRGSTATRWR